MRFGSVCSGIEAASSAWLPLGWESAWLAEVEPFPCAVLAHHYPDVPNLGDITADDFIDRAIACGPIDVLVGGTPCQSFSVAGLRGGLADDRGALSLRYAQLVHELHPGVALWENVPGVLSRDDNAFGCILAALVGADSPFVSPRPGETWTGAGMVSGPTGRAAWRILDAKYFGVAQQRRRVFVVRCPRDGADPVEILLVEEGVRWNLAPGRAAGEDVANALTERPDRGGGNSEGQRLIPSVSPALKARDYKGPSSDGDGDGAILVPTVYQCHGNNVGALGTLRTGNGNATGGVPFVAAFDPQSGGDCRGLDLRHSAQLQREQVPGVLCFDERNVTSRSNRSRVEPGRECHTLHEAPPTVATHMQVRKLTPVECERLQGFPDGHTAIPWRGKPADDCPDGPRYRSLGNSMAVPVIRWIGRKIQAAHCQP